MTWRNLPLLTATVLLISLAACTDNTEATGSNSGGGTVEVTSTDDECLLSQDQVTPGRVVFEVTNKGSKITELHFESEGGQDDRR